MITDAVSRTIKCDNKECEHTITFDPQNQEQITNLPTWLRTFRTIVNGQNAKFGYCSDVCEVKGVTTGDHNVPEPPKIQQATSQADVKQAAKEAEAATEATAALKSGSIKLTDGD